VSVIGLGSESDCDAAFLRDVAERGGGRIFFADQAARLPEVFAQETVAVARSAFIEGAIPVTDAGGWVGIAQKAIPWPARVDGYNLSYLRPKATAACVSGDEYHAPLVAFQPCGTGRAAALSFTVGGPFSGSVRAWPGFSDFIATLGRWLALPEGDAGASIATHVAGQVLGIDFRYDDRWEERLAKSPPRLVAATGARGEPAEIRWSRMSPGLYRATLELPPGEWVRGAVISGETSWRFGPVGNPLNPEWDQSGDRGQAVLELSKHSGGRAIADLRESWRPRPPGAPLPLSRWLLVAALLCFVADALLTRIHRERAG